MIPDLARLQPYVPTQPNIPVDTCTLAVLRIIPVLVRQTADQRIQAATDTGKQLSAHDQEILHLILQAGNQSDQKIFWWLRWVNQSCHPASLQLQMSALSSNLRIITPLFHEAGEQLNPIIRSFIGRVSMIRFLYGLHYLGCITAKTLDNAMAEPQHWPCSELELYYSSSHRDSRPPSLAQQQLRARFEVFLRMHSPEPDIISRLIDWLGSDRQDTNLAMAASSFECSPRTFNRRIASLGSSYQEELDQYQCRRVMAFLANHQSNLNQAAAILGFQNPSNFGRACRRWFGLTPADLQEALHNSSGTIDATGRKT